MLFTPRTVEAKDLTFLHAELFHRAIVTVTLILNFAVTDDPTFMQMKINWFFGSLTILFQVTEKLTHRLTD
jgi:hypothetical protein